MKKIRLLLALLVASIGSVQGAWAERVAPTEPTVTLTDGGEYYLYNVGNDNAVHYNSAASTSTIYPRAFNSHATKVTINTIDDGYYTIKLTDANKYFYRYSSTTIQANTSSKSSFSITEVDGGYTFQTPNSSYYNESQYMGFVSNSDYLRGDVTTNIVWKILPAEDESFDYIARLRLYNYLCQSDEYSYNVDKYEVIYANEASTRAEISNAADELKSALGFSSKRTSPSWSESPVLLVNTGSKAWSYSSNSSSEFQVTIGYNAGVAVLKATVYVDEDATFVYATRCSGSGGKYEETYLDGNLYQHIEGYQLLKGNNRYFVELTPGLHEIEIKAVRTSNSNDYSYFYLNDIGVVMTPTITVNLTQAGSLGTEVLYNVDHIKDVRRIVIKGEMNDEDWARVNMMSNVLEIDLTDANVNSLPSVKPGSFFHKITLPKMLTTIQNEALRGTRLDEITLPETLINIGEYAFYGTRIKEAILPEAVTSVGQYAFANNCQLKYVKWSPNTTTIPSHCFYDDNVINSFDMPDEVTTIGEYAFYQNYNCDYQLPASIKSIGQYAFYNARFAESLVIPSQTSISNDAFGQCRNLKYVTIGEGVSFGNYSSSYYTFYQCTNLKEIEFPTTFYTINYDFMLYGCSNLEKVTLKSPTMVSGSYYKSFFSNCSSNITIRVPNYLVNTYKLDSYWYNYNIEGFSTADITDWAIQNSLVFYSQDRFEGAPNIDVWAVGSWAINGDTPQQIGNFYTNGWSNRNSDGIGSYSKVISTCDNVTINQHYQHGYGAYNNISGSPYYGRWHFLCLPFDFKINEITTNNNARFAVRYYDGANRAANGTGGNWKDFASDAIVPAGTGFIIQTNKDDKVWFHSLDNETKQYVVSNRIFTKALEANVSEQTSNKGWNLVGNPWMSYYNIHKMNFTGPITVYNGYNKTYKAYSVIDDDYAILPNQAFFVQCPDEVNSISFPVDGRQMTSVIESQNAARAEKASERKLIDVQLCSQDGEEIDTEETQSDKTRFVLNQEASMDYETTRDASKFLENGTSCPQIYTIEQGEMLSINERPLDDGTVQIGVIIPQDGTYTISAPRCQFQNITLVDNETGIETDLLADGSYTFTVSAGTYESRFVLRVGGIVVTEISKIENGKSKIEDEVYDIQGRRIESSMFNLQSSMLKKGLYIVNGKKVLK